MMNHSFIYFIMFTHAVTPTLGQLTMFDKKKLEYFIALL